MCRCRILKTKWVSPYPVGTRECGAEDGLESSNKTEFGLILNKIQSTGAAPL